MRIIIATIFIAASLCWGQDTSKITKWDKETAGFRGIPFGSTLSELKKVIGTCSCVDSKKEGLTYGLNCISDFKIGEVKIKCLLILEDSLFAAASCFFPSDSYDYLKEAFIEKYGMPMKTNSEVLQNNFGVEFNNEKLSWEGNKILIYLNKYQSNSNDGSFYICLKTYTQNRYKAFQNKKKSASNDF